MEDKPPILPPPSEPFPGSKTPGWNDPPTLQYNPVPSSGGRTRLNLNKRIAFPLQGNTGVAKPTAVVQPNQSTTSSSLSGSSGGGGGVLPLSMTPVTQPIAVVHPMSSVNTSVSPPPPPSYTNLPRVSPSSTYISDASHTSATTTTTTTAAAAVAAISTTPQHDTTTVPTMHVPAMPRQESGEVERRSVVQHI